MIVALLVGAAVWVFVIWKGGDSRAARPLPAARLAASAPLADPLARGRAPELDSARPAPSGDWVRARPAEAFQYSLDADVRGVEPCNSPATAEARERLKPLGNGFLYVPEGSFERNGRFNLIIHLHGQEVVLRELVASGERFVLYTLTSPPEKSYAPAFSGPRILPDLITRIEAEVSERVGRALRAQRVAVSAWSAGFEGVRAILHQPEEPRMDAVLLIDGLHAPRDSEVFKARMAPFVKFAERASQGERFMAITHSSIPTPSYASSTETAHYLTSALGGKPLAVRRDDGFGLELVESFSKGDLHVRGYAGNDKADHCAQLFLLRNIFGALGKRWKD